MESLKRERERSVTIIAEAMFLFSILLLLLLFDKKASGDALHGTLFYL